jgi:DNA-binding beta-propeller fold protein YncE
VSLNQSNRKIIAVFCITVLLAACSAKLRKAETESAYRFFPPPPAGAKIQYLTKISSSSDINKKQSWLKRYVFGSEPVKSINKPYGITLNNGKIYICDTMLPGLEIIDLESSTFEYFIPNGAGELRKPTNCALDEQGNLYVADTERGQVVIFDAALNYRSAIGDGQDMRPTDVSINGNNIWLCDLQSHQIKVFSAKTSRLLFAFPDLNQNRPGYLYSPTNLYVKNDKVYVTDTGDSRVKIFSLDGSYLTSVGSFGKSSGQFVRPKGVAVDREGNICVVDAAFENVQVFNSEGGLLTFFGGSYKSEGDMYLPAKVAIDFENTGFFEKYVAPGYDLKYLILVTNQYGPDKVSIYGFIENEVSIGE